jgi:hypothetical protein
LHFYIQFNSTLKTGLSVALAGLAPGGISLGGGRLPAGHPIPMVRADQFLDELRRFEKDGNSPSLIIIRMGGNHGNGAAGPMLNSFTSEPDFIPVTALPDQVPHDGMNLKASATKGLQRQLATASMKLPIQEAGEDILSRINWHSTRGCNTPYPKRNKQPPVVSWRPCTAAANSSNPPPPWLPPQSSGRRLRLVQMCSSS